MLNRRYRRTGKRGLLLLLGLMLASCASLPPPRHTTNLCSIFTERRDWRTSAFKAQQRWQAPVPVQMAIINQESSFVQNARPPRYRFLGILPLWRVSSAYGYGQAKDDTWDWYVSKTGRTEAARDDFADVTDFIGWYMKQSRTLLGISRQDAYRQYLAYHEGHGGYRRKSHEAKPWLLRVARRVARTARQYASQLTACT